MDAEKYKRRDIKTVRQITQKPLGISTPVPEVLYARPQNPRNPRLAPVHARTRVSATPVATPATQFQAETPAPAPPRVRMPAIDMELPGEDSPSRFSTYLKSAKARRTRRWAFRGVALSLVLMVTMGGLLVSQTYSKANKVFSGSTGTATALKANVAPDLLKGEGAGRINVLMLGRGGGTHSAPDLTDTMMLASIDPINHTSTLFSIPRDMWVTVQGQGVMKLNAAWEAGEFKYLGKVAPGSQDPKAIQAGFDMVDQTVEDVLGVNIDYNVVVDFQAFRQAIDTVNGVNVTVPTDLIDPTMAWENSNNPLLAKAGPQVFSGTQALLYVRSRETTSDFARSMRQRAVLLALKDKVDSLGTLSNPVKLSGLLNAFGNNVHTDLSLNNASRLYGIVKNIPDTSTTSVGLADGPTPLVTTGNINGQSVVLPKSGLFKYDDIQTFVRSQLKDPYIVKENARILVLNGSTQAGVATTMSAELKGYGYNVVGSANAPTSGWSHTTLVDLSKGKKKYTKHYLEQHFNVHATNTLADDTIATNGADFAIIIGSDEATPTKIQAN